MVQNGSEICDKRRRHYRQLLNSTGLKLNLRWIRLAKNRQKKVGQVQPLTGFETKPKHNDADTTWSTKQLRQLRQSNLKWRPQKRWFSTDQMLHRCAATQDDKWYFHHHFGNNNKQMEIPSSLFPRTAKQLSLDESKGSGTQTGPTAVRWNKNSCPNSPIHGNDLWVEGATRRKYIRRPLSAVVQPSKRNPSSRWNRLVYWERIGRAQVA